MRMESSHRTTGHSKTVLAPGQGRSKAKRDPCRMQLVQMAVSENPFTAALQRELERNGEWLVVRVDRPDLSLDGIVLVDELVLDHIDYAIPSPERVVLVCHNHSAELSRAWEAGIISVVFESDSPETAMLAVLSAALRVPHRPALPCARH